MMLKGKPSVGGGSMSRGLALVLALLVLAAALFAGWYSTTRVVYFAPELLTQPSGCRYFQNEEPVIDEFEADWFGGELRKLQEPSLYRLATDGGPDRSSHIRFLWIRSFHDPVAIRIERSPDGKAFLTARQRDADLGPQEYGKSRTLARALTETEIRQLDTVLSRTRVLHERPKICEGGVDGARWIFEATDGRGSYTFVSRFSPGDGAAREFGEFMIGLTDWDFDRIY